MEKVKQIDINNIDELSDEEKEKLSSLARELNEKAENYKRDNPDSSAFEFSEKVCHDLYHNGLLASYMTESANTMVKSACNTRTRIIVPGYSLLIGAVIGATIATLAVLAVV